MNEIYAKFTTIGITFGSLVTFGPWLFTEVPTTFACQASGAFTVLAFGLAFAFAAYIYSSPKQVKKYKTQSCKGGLT